MDIATINVVEESEAAPLLAAKKRTTCRSRRDTGATKKSTARQSNKGKVGFQSSTEETSDEGASTSNRMLHVPERRESEQTPYLIFRAIIHTAVAAWPLTFAIFGLACFLDCPANPLLPLMNFMAGLSDRQLLYFD
ncbi:uncharacterized protein TNCT_677701 [Trichonephila clavata]|uniref:Uncharacterized protein n=1 Tax=Trichonephila clavata TaxID=2740835 RepID=A0A8X6GA97_TRICU|nr:uncharacterized protein TNCT_677701 [Trichonephila clavata]